MHGLIMLLVDSEVIPRIQIRNKKLVSPAKKRLFKTQFITDTEWWIYWTNLTLSAIALAVS
jgi:hypothetical protein